MATKKKIIKVEDSKKKKDDKFDLEDIKDFVEDHGDDIGKVVSTIGTYMNSKNKTTKKKTTTKTKKNDDTLSKAIDVISDLVGKK